jgi:hypothetical protein
MKFKVTIDSFAVPRGGCLDETQPGEQGHLFGDRDELPTTTAARSKPK